MDDDQSRVSAKRSAQTGGAAAEMDILGNVLLNTRLLSTVINILDMAAPWGMRIPSRPSNLALGATLLEGPCWFESDAWPRTEMRPGDGFLTLRGHGHRLSSSPDAPTVDFTDFVHAHGLPAPTIDRPQRAAAVTRVGTGASRTRLLVFALIAEDAVRTSLIANLPEVMFLRAGPDGPSTWTRAAADFLVRDSRARPGYAATATRLVELVFTDLVREHILTDPEIGAGWMRGLRDPAIGRAINLIHSRPGASWTVPRLAREAGLGRSTFARRFVKLLGVSPIDYLIDHRMDVACARLSVDRDPVSKVAEALGYRSDRAFREAFRRRFGVPPSRYVRTLQGEHSADHGESMA